MEEMISSLGFPIAMAIGMWYFFVQKDKANREDTNRIIDGLREDAKEDRQMYRETINSFDNKLDKFSIVLENNNNELSIIKDDVKTIKEKVGV